MCRARRQRASVWDLTMSPPDHRSERDLELQDYLDGMFASGPAPVPPAPAPVAAPVEPRPARPVPRPATSMALPVREFAKPLTLPRAPLPPPPPAPAPVAAPVLAQPVAVPEAPLEVVAPVQARPAAPAVDVSSVAATQAPQVPVSNWAENGRPRWAQTRFECLMFKVGGLTMAVPLIDLGSIQPLTDALTPLFGQADWFMGLLPVNGANVRVVDSARIVMPERYRPGIADGYGYVITLFGSHWGLAADSVAESISLLPEQVRWRTERAKRSWLAGTVVDHMCALLDVSALKEVLDGAERKRRPRGAAPGSA